MPTNRVLCLCTGLQSGGTTLISWCFLQRADMDGILDANNDMFADVPPGLACPYTWLKTTVGSFRTSEQIAYFEELGWTVRPLLICRDVRAAYASLRIKHYGRNGTTAEDPPLRLRFRRFREDWELFQARGWPTVCYEQFVADPEETLAAACAQLDLPWDDAMLAWPKPKSAIFDMRHGNETFHRNCQGNLGKSLRHAASPDRFFLPAGENDWLEKEFAQYNQINGYPAHLDPLIDLGAQDRDVPSFNITRRLQWRQKQVPLQYLLRRIARWFTGKPAAKRRQPRPLPAKAPAAAPSPGMSYSESQG